MKICSYKVSSNLFSQTRMGILLEDDSKILDPNLIYQLHIEKNGFYKSKEKAFAKCPPLLSQLLETQDDPLARLTDSLELYRELKKSGDLTLNDNIPVTYDLGDKAISLKKPLDKIETYRDFYAHEKHVKKGFEKRNEPVPEAWYEIPAYYKGSTVGFIGPDEEILWPSYSNKLDFELELAVVIGKDGKNISEKDATKHILGFTILNDISARDIQKKEMSIRLGPAKGKDFCSIIGPVITTIDEFKGKEPNLKMTAKINGEEWSKGQSGDSHYSFSQMIEHASRDEWLIAGDLLGSGTVGTGCGLELDKWIQPGDSIELEVEGIGKLINKVGQRSK